MKSSSEDISSVMKKLTIEVEAKEVDKLVDKAYRQLGKTARIPGFRVGKAPRSVLERRFSNDVAEDVARDIINDSLPKAIEEMNTMPLGAPLLEKDELKPGQNFTYSATIEVRPPFDLSDYVGIEVDKEKLAVTDSDVAERLEQIRNANGSLKSIEPARPVQKDDHVVLNYEVFEEGVAQEDLKASNFLLKVGQNEFNEDFEKALIGSGKEEEKEIQTQFPEDYPNARMAGRNLNFKVKVVDIKELELPELNDDFVKNFGPDFKTLEDLKEKLRETMVNQEQKRVDNDLKQQILQKITSTVDFEIPQILLESELNYAYQNFKQNLTQRGSSLEQAGITEEKFKTDFKPFSERRVKEILVLEKIAEKDNITLDEADLAKAYKEMAISMGLEEKVLRQYYEARGLENSLREKLLEEKTLNYLIDNAKVREVEREALSQDQPMGEGE